MPGIKKVSIRETKIMLPDAEAAEGFRNENTWVLDTEGTNLLDVSFCPSHLFGRFTEYFLFLALQRRSFIGAGALLIVDGKVTLSFPCR